MLTVVSRGGREKGFHATRRRFRLLPLPLLPWCDRVNYEILLCAEEEEKMGRERRQSREGRGGGACCTTWSTHERTRYEEKTTSSSTTITQMGILASPPLRFSTHSQKYGLRNSPSAVPPSPPSPRERTQGFHLRHRPFSAFLPSRDGWRIPHRLSPRNEGDVPSFGSSTWR